MSNGGPDTGGADLGAMGQVGGTLPGFKSAVRFASRGPEWAALATQGGFHPRQIRQAGKDFNDTGFAPTVGVNGGQRVLDAGGLAGL
jgi:hypothetical protein